MNRQEILGKCVDEIETLIKMDAADRRAIWSAVNDAFTQYAILLGGQHDKTLKNALGLED